MRRNVCNRRKLSVLSGYFVTNLSRGRFSITHFRGRDYSRGQWRCPRNRAFAGLAVAGRNFIPPTRANAAPGLSDMSSAARKIRCDRIATRQEWNLDALRVLRGGVVPHAGWICSGAIAGETIGALRTAMPDADLIVVFGAIHTRIPIALAALDSHAKWIEPSGESLG